MPAPSRPSSRYSALPRRAETEEQGGERLQKVLARAGFGSRRLAEELIAEGRVSVNDVPARLGRRVDLSRDRVAVDGTPVGILPGLVHYLLNKPPGVVSTARDPEGRPTVLSLVPEEPRVFSVGRLDLGTEGLLILTNDGELAQLLSHPSHGIEKEYLAEVEGDPAPGAIRALREGVVLEPGVKSAPARVSRTARGVIRIVVHEGRYHEVRRMCEAIGHPVRRLVRTRIGPVADPHLAPGRWRPLSTAEVRALSTASAEGGGRVEETTSSGHRAAELGHGRFRGPEPSPVGSPGDDSHGAGNPRRDDGRRGPSRAD